MTRDGSPVVPVNGDLNLRREDIQDIATFFALPEDAVVERLHTYTRAEMAQEWRAASPQTPAEMRALYASVDLYVWELMQWHAGSGYQRYLDVTTSLTDQFPPATHPRVLDYGCGTACLALMFAAKGYQVTIADVPGKTLAFARHRFARRGLPVQVIEVTSDRPALGAGQDILVCFDVFEHLPDPAATLFRLSGRPWPGIRASPEHAGTIWCSSTVTISFCQPFSKRE
jgi:2-polyprenyl-3-methyl-5-hydroxy-6-metoxy-1,4-benzoquinol methylase